MEMDGLFSLASPAGPAAPAGFDSPDADSPLAVRMRPASIDELVGQEHLLAPGAPLRQLVTGDSPMSVILWGPPGTGKTTIAHLVARATNRKFVALSALSAGVKDVRAVIDTARTERRRGGSPTVLFIDEVHRFSKTQQDSLLAAVEDRTVTLLAATTENPYFSVISPLLSRCVLLTLQALGDDQVRVLLRRAVTDPRGLGGAVTLSPEAEEHLVRLAAGDVRKSLTALEAAAASAQAQGATTIDLATAEKAVDVAAVRYDRDGDAHYDVTSAFIKSMRGSDPDAALHWLARMLVAGEDPRFIARRIVIFASEDVGMADPQALLVATAAAQAVQNVGLPEAGLNLAQAVVHLATAPKSNSVTTALAAAMDDVRAGRGGAVPAHLRDAHYPGARGLGHGRGYRYPHDDPRGVVTQQYIPDDLVEAEYYQPTDHGAERAVRERVPRLRRIVRGLPSSGASSSPGSSAPGSSGAGSSGAGSSAADSSAPDSSGRASSDSVAPASSRSASSGAPASVASSSEPASSMPASAAAASSEVPSSSLPSSASLPSSESLPSSASSSPGLSGGASGAEGRSERDASQSSAGSSLVEVAASPAVTPAETGQAAEGETDGNRRIVAEPGTGQDDSGETAGGEKP